MIDAQLQPVVFGDQRIADQHARHARIALGKIEQHGDDVAQLPLAIFLRGGDLVDEPENGGFDELDQALEHLGLACKVPIERRLRDLEPCCKRGGGDAIATRLLQHAGERLQNLQPPLARLGAGSAGCFWGIGVGGGIHIRRWSATARDAKAVKLIVLEAPRAVRNPRERAPEPVYAPP